MNLASTAFIAVRKNKKDPKHLLSMQRAIVKWVDGDSHVTVLWVEEEFEGENERPGKIFTTTRLKCRMQNSMFNC